MSDIEVIGKYIPVVFANNRQESKILMLQDSRRGLHFVGDPLQNYELADQTVIRSMQTIASFAIGLGETTLLLRGEESQSPYQENFSASVLSFATFKELLSYIPSNNVAEVYLNEVWQKLADYPVVSNPATLRSLWRTRLQPALNQLQS